MAWRKERNGHESRTVRARERRSRVSAEASSVRCAEHVPQTDRSSGMRHGPIYKWHWPGTNPSWAFARDQSSAGISQGNLSVALAKDRSFLSTCQQPIFQRVFSRDQFYSSVGARARPSLAREARRLRDVHLRAGERWGLGKFATTVPRPPPPFEQTVARWQYK